MDVNDLRSAVTVIGLLLFLALVAWVYARGRKAAFDEAARLPFLEEDKPSASPAAREEGRAS
jgi:cytochrome c oxidase cbb3-type subunit 4